MRLARMGDRDLAAVQQDLAFVGGVVAHGALDQRALARAVFAQQRMEGAGLDAHRDIVERRQCAEVLAEADQFQRRRTLVGNMDGADHAHDIASITAVELATAPNTPPCISTIFSAARWLPLSVAPVQSSKIRHSKPRSLASRMVVCTQTSVVMPVSTMLSIPRVRSISSRSVAQNEPLPGLSITRSPAAGARTGMISHPASPRTRIRPHGPGSPMPAPIWRLRQRLLGGRSLRSGRWPSRVWITVQPALRAAASSFLIGSIGAPVSDRSEPILST